MVISFVIIKGYKLEPTKEERYIWQNVEWRRVPNVKLCVLRECVSLLASVYGNMQIIANPRSSSACFIYSRNSKRPM